MNLGCWYVMQISRAQAACKETTKSVAKYTFFVCLYNEAHCYSKQRLKIHSFRHPKGPHLCLCSRLEVSIERPHSTTTPSFPENYNKLFSLPVPVAGSFHVFISIVNIVPSSSLAYGGIQIPPPNPWVLSSVVAECTGTPFMSFLPSFRFGSVS